MSEYYFIKYPFKNYYLRGTDGMMWTMFSVPVRLQIEMYVKRIGVPPRSFFDIGCATGEIMSEAYDLGLKVGGVDIAKYPSVPEKNQHLFDGGNVQIKSILDCGDIEYDIVFSNGSLLYLEKDELDTVLRKLKKSKMLIAIHNTKEDIAESIKMDSKIIMRNSKIIESKQWWLDKLSASGFYADFDKKYGCFCAVPHKTK